MSQAEGVTQGPEAAPGCLEELEKASGQIWAGRQGVRFCHGTLRIPNLSLLAFLFVRAGGSNKLDGLLA